MKILFKILIALSLTLLISCKRERDETPDDSKEKVTVKLTNPVVNVYIENSGSMFGYINKDAEFKTDVRELLVSLKHYLKNDYNNENVHLFFINSKIYPINEVDKIDFITNLTPVTFKVGKTNESNLNEIFNQVLNKTDKNTISILVSDCIYSVDGLAKSLNVCKTRTKDAFITKSDKSFPISTQILKLNSKFNGIYYDMNNGNHKLNNEMRPYYIILLGSDLALNDISSKVNFSRTELQGYQNKLILTSNNYSSKIYYTLVNANSDNGRYKTLREKYTDEANLGMEKIELNERQKSNFTFSIAIDLSNVPVENAYAETISNYKIIGGNYKIKYIHKFDSKLLSPTALPILEKKSPTHIITFEATTKNFTDLKCVLVNKIPDWVNGSSTEDDTNIINNKNKTFGFKYLIEGISEANEKIKPASKEFFEIKLTIKNN